jgi:hypothetical protein
MNRIRNLEQLRKNASEEDIREIVTEYLMEVIGKADKLDEIQKGIANGTTLREIKKVL